MMPTLRTSSAPVLVLAVVVAVAAAACQFLPGGGPGPLDGTGWRAVEVRGQAPVAGSEPTVVFDEQGIGGTTGCNSYGGPVEVMGASLKVGDLVQTLIGCDGPIGTIEGEFIRALSKADRISLRADGMLVIAGPEGEIVLRSDPAVVL